MAELRINVIAKSNTNSQNSVKGIICRADVLRIIYERKNRFSERVRLCDIDDILETLNLKRSEAQTVENMIRGHRRKGFKDPPKSFDPIATKDIPNPPKTVEEMRRSPSPIPKNLDINSSPLAVPEVRNKRLFDSSGFHDPKNALQPAKIRYRKMNQTPATESSLQTSISSTRSPSPTQNEPLPTTEHSHSIAEISQPQQEPPAPLPLPPIPHIQTLLNTQNTRPLSPPEINKPPAIKRGRRIKITPRRDSMVNLSQKAIGWPKISQHIPAIIHPNFSYVPVQRIAVLSEHQSNFDRSFAPTHHLLQTSAIAQLLAHQQIFSARRYASQQRFGPMIQQTQNSLRYFYENYIP